MSLLPKKIGIVPLLSVVITVVVTLIIGTHAYFSYTSLKESFHNQTVNSIQKSAKKLSNNSAPLIESYQIAQYLKLIKTEIMLNKYLAITIEDKRYSEIIGQKGYKDGYILINDKLHRFGESAVKYQKQINNAYMSYSEPITVDDETVGKITIYATSEQLDKQIEYLIHTTQVDSLSIIVILIIAFYVLLRFLYVEPLYNIIYILKNTDSFGVPKLRVPDSRFKELSLLAKKINNMVRTIRHSQQELKEKNRSLALEKERFQLAVEGTLDGMWDWNIQTDTLIHSERFETMLGYEAGEFPDNIEFWKTLIHPDDVEKAFEVIENYFQHRGKQKYENTFRMQAKDGSWRWITSRGKAVFDATNQPVRFVGFNTDVTALMMHSLELEHASLHDLLTGLPNRIKLNEELSQSILEHEKLEEELAVLYIDLDGFKEINDKYGHALGDEIIIKLAKRIKSLIREEDLIARLGGDEFIVISTHIQHHKSFDSFLKRLLFEIHKPIVSDHETSIKLSVSSSIGVTFFSKENIVGVDALLRQADQAMYEAKNTGKNKYLIYNVDSAKEFKNYQNNKKEFLEAIKNKELEMYYQTKIDLRSNEVMGVEALLRWNHPQRGVLVPPLFLDKFLDDLSVMDILDKFILDQSIGQLSNWIEEGKNIVL